jgi:hypothetical protein
MLDEKLEAAVKKGQDEEEARRQIKRKKCEAGLKAALNHFDADYSTYRPLVEKQARETGVKAAAIPFEYFPLDVRRALDDCLAENTLRMDSCRARCMYGERTNFVVLDCRSIWERMTTRISL